jgi:hypothetical protein
MIFGVLENDPFYLYEQRTSKTWKMNEDEKPRDLGEIFHGDIKSTR